MTRTPPQGAVINNAEAQADAAYRLRVAVFGCGPAGLMAAHAAALSGCDVVVYSKARKSRLYGCQYLHAPIPGVTEGDPVDVRYQLVGTEGEYREKVYGGTWNGDVSPGTLDTDHEAWDIRQTYDKLWEMYGSFVIDWDFSQKGSVETALDIDPDIVISTLPAPLLCSAPNHSFNYEKVWALGDAPEEGQVLNYGLQDGTVVCDGTRDRAWYRASKVFGYTTVEWPGYLRPPIEGVAEVKKPLATDCTCHPDIIRMGRYGLWTKGVLSHEAFYVTQLVIADELSYGRQAELEL
jgi:hypothetical protein